MKEIAPMVEWFTRKSQKLLPIGHAGSNPAGGTTSRYRNWISDETSNLAPQKGIVGSSPTRLTKTSLIPATGEIFLGFPRLETSASLK